MTVTESNLPVTATEALDTTKVTQTNGDSVHREVVVVASPETLAAYQEVDLAPLAARVILYDLAGNPPDAIAIHDGYSLKVSSLAAPANGFEGYGEVIGANGNNIDVWSGPTAVQPEPVPAGFTPNVISTSANDDVSGAGVSEVTIHYLDTAGAEQVGTFTMNGQTQVNHPSITDCMFINEFFASELDGGLVAAGRIDVRNSTTVMNSIPVAGNWAMSTMRQVPAGKQLCVDFWHASSAVGAGGKQATVRLRSTSSRDGTASDAGLYLFKDTFILRDSTGAPRSFNPKLIVPALSTIKTSTWTSGAVDVAATWSGWLENI